MKAGGGNERAARGRGPVPMGSVAMGP
jgi:hypothetical protein